MDNFEHIFYLNCPHFTVGQVDQWGEHGYLLFEGTVYFYEEDRKKQRGSTFSPMTVNEFLVFAEKSEIEVPDHFMAHLREVPDE